jgi:lipoprotein-releasing system permease protein
MLKFWMVWRYLKEGKKYLSLTFVLSVFGVALGVAALVISMAVVSGYENTLRESVVNLQGHVMVMQHGGIEEGLEEAENRIREVVPETQKISRFVIIEGLIAHKKKLNGILLEGLDPKTVFDVTALQKALIAGQIDLAPTSVQKPGSIHSPTSSVGSDRSEPADLNSGEILPSAVIGKGIAQKFSLSVGDEFRLVIPISRSKSTEGFRPKAQKFIVRGVVDLGRADYDARYVITDLASAQSFGEVGSRISGWRLMLSDYALADKAVQRIEEQLKFPYWARSWRDVNRNLFQAVQYERAVIFIIVMLMVVAAAFNVASTLFLSVVRRYQQISILKAMGVSNQFVRELFTRQGLIIGFLGVFFGVLMGWGGCQVFLWVQKRWSIFPGEVYKLDHVDLSIRAVDIAVILASTLLICYVSTLAPARRGAKLQPVEGLKYE